MDKRKLKRLKRKEKTKVADFDVVKNGKFDKKAKRQVNKLLKNANQKKIDYYKDIIEVYKQEGKTLTSRQLNAMYSKDKLQIFLSNLQLDLNDIAKSIKLEGIDVDMTWLNDQSHWTFGHMDDSAIIKLPDGSEAYFVFNYYEHTYVLEVENGQSSN